MCSKTEDGIVDESCVKVKVRLWLPMLIASRPYDRMPSAMAPHCGCPYGPSRWVEPTRPIAWFEPPGPPTLLLTLGRTPKRPYVFWSTLT